MPAKKSFDEVVRNIESACRNNGTKLISTEYNGIKKPLMFICGCGKTFERSYAKFMAGTHMCPECKKRDLSERYKFDIETVKKIINDAGCKYISGEYLNNNSVLTLQCACGAIFQKRFLKFQSGQNRCVDCGNMLTKGENSHLYKNGCSSVYSSLRGTLLKWKALVRDDYEDTCPITGLHGKECDVHHIVSLESIYKPIADRYGIEINNKTKLSDLPNYQILVDIKKEVAAKHTLSIGILISKKIHYEYHALYRGSECSETNFAEFLKSKYNVDLSTILRREQSQ